MKCDSDALLHFSTFKQSSKRKQNKTKQESSLSNTVTWEILTHVKKNKIHFQKCRMSPATFNFPQPNPDHVSVRVRVGVL